MEAGYLAVAVGVAFEGQAYFESLKFVVGRALLIAIFQTAWASRLQMPWQARKSPHTLRCAGLS